MNLVVGCTTDISLDGFVSMAKCYTWMFSSISIEPPHSKQGFQKQVACCLVLKLFEQIYQEKEEWPELKKRRNAFSYDQKLAHLNWMCEWQWWQLQQKLGWLPTCQPLYGDIFKVPVDCPHLLILLALLCEWRTSIGCSMKKLAMVNFSCACKTHSNHIKKKMNKQMARAWSKWQWWRASIIGAYREQFIDLRAPIPWLPTAHFPFLPRSSSDQRGKILSSKI